MNNYLIEIEGIDKSGKDILVSYLCKLTNYKYVAHSRGLLSNMVYSDKYKKSYNYDLIYKPIIVYLDVDEEDRQVRCKLTNEPPIDANLDRNLFQKHIKILKSKGFTILYYNTSETTPYKIAKDIINKIERNLI